MNCIFIALFYSCRTFKNAFIAHIHTVVVEATLQGATYSPIVINIHMNTHTQWKSHQQQFGVQYLAQGRFDIDCRGWESNY